MALSESFFASRAPKKSVKVLASTLEMVERLESSAAANHTKAYMLQLYVNELLNDELELLAGHALQMNVEMDEPAVMGAVCRGDARLAVSAAISIMRRRMSKMLRDHEREVEEE